MAGARRGGLLVLVGLIAVGCLHLETQRRLREQQDNRHSTPLADPRHQVAPSKHGQGIPVELDLAEPPKRSASNGCRPHDADCIIAQLRSQLSFTGVGDGGCTSTDRDCKEEYSQWLRTAARVGTVPCGIHLTFPQPQQGAALSPSDDGTLVLSWTTSSDAGSECSTAEYRLWGQADTPDVARISSGWARQSAGNIAEHSVRLEGLISGAWYRYKVGCDDHGWSTEKAFRAPGGSLSRGDRWSFVATSDTGSTRAAREVFRAMAAEVAPPIGDTQVAAQQAAVWFALHGGDVSYGMDDAEPAKRTAMAAGFFIGAEPLASAVPMATALGNHDLRMFQLPSTADNRVVSDTATERIMADQLQWLPITTAVAAPYLLRPGEGKVAARAPLYYTFQLGGVRMIVLDTDEPYHLDSAQHRWLRTQMRIANSEAGRIECPWLIVQMHRPMYSASPWYENTRASGKGTHATGHNGTTVMRPMRRQKADCYSSPGVPVYVNVGMGGAGSLGRFKDKPALISLAKEQWNAVSLDSGYGYVKVTVSTQSPEIAQLLIEYHDIGERRWQPWQQKTPDRQEAAVLDSVLIVKQAGS